MYKHEEYREVSAGRGSGPPAACDDPAVARSLLPKTGNTKFRVRCLPHRVEDDTVTAHSLSSSTPSEGTAPAARMLGPRPAHAPPEGLAGPSQPRQVLGAAQTKPSGYWRQVCTTT